MVVLCLMSLALAVAAFFAGRRWRPWIRYIVAFVVFVIPVVTVTTIVALVGLPASQFHNRPKHGKMIAHVLQAPNYSFKRTRVPRAA